MEQSVPLKISEFMGVSRRMDSEDLPGPYFSTLQNIWERKLGELTARGGSVAIPLVYPSNITAIDNGEVMRLRQNIKRRVLAVHCAAQTDETALAAMTSSVTAALVTASGGRYQTSLGSNMETDLSTIASMPQAELQFVGYGINYTRLVNVTYAASYNAVQVSVPTALDSNITGINVYVVGVSNTSLSGVNISTWIGFIDLITTPTGTFTFTQAPLTSTAYPGSTLTYGSANPSFTMEEKTGGSLTPGKTYYVAVLANYWYNGGTVSATSAWRTRLTAVGSITLTTGNAIQINNIVGDSPAYMVAIGEDAHLLQPQYITNVVTTNTINSLVSSSPNLVDITRIDATNSEYLFRAADTSIKDMLVRFEESGAIRPIFCSRLTNINKADYSATYLNSMNYAAFSLSKVVAPFGEGSRFCFAQLGEGLYFVNDFSGDLNLSVSGFSLDERTQSGYFITDGRIAGSVIVKHGTTSPPKSKYIAAFQEAIVLAGGSQASGSYNRVYFSRAYDPYNFSQAGGTSIAYVQVQSGGEPISGIGVYSISTSDAGVKAELLIGKQNSCYKLSALPNDFTTNPYMDVLSEKIGVASHWTIRQTHVGTMFAGLNNVYLMSPEGEPAPVGDDISSFIMPDSPTVGVDPTYWNAVYHDECYKLAYSTNAGVHPNKELWLNVSKMKANKGLPVWYGPHSGRQINYSFVDNYFVAGDRERRFCVDTTLKRLYLADRADYSQDFGSDMEFVIEIPNRTGPEDEMAAYMNKLLTRYYWKAKVNGTVSATQVISADDSAVETGALVMAPDAAGVTYDDFLAQPVKVFPGFPTGRVRGRLLKFKWTYSGAVQFAISGLVLFFRPERRRI